MSINNYTNILTLGQAACLVLSLPPSRYNRVKAKKIVTESCFDVTYLKHVDPLLPVAVGKSIKQMSPTFYCSYPETPPQSYDEETDAADEDISDLNDEYENYNSAVVFYKPKKVSKKTGTKTKILRFSREIFHLRNPKSPHYNYLFLTSATQYNIITDRFDVKDLTQRGYARLLSKSDFLSYTITYKGVKGRWVYVMKKQYRDLF